MVVTGVAWRAVAAGAHLKSWTVGEYERMAEAGVLGEDDRVELLGGEIIEMAPIGPGHAATVRALARLFHQQVGDGCVVSVQDPIRLAERSEPQPDVALLVWRDDLYLKRLAGPADVLLVVEVADSSVESDRDLKLPAYGQAGIPEAWLVDLAAGVVEAHSGPDADGYDHVVVFGPAEELSVTAMPEIAVPVASILTPGGA